MRLGAVKTYFYYLQEGLTMKLQQIETLNTIYYVEKFLTFFKPFMKKEVYDMVRLWWRYFSNFLQQIYPFFQISLHYKNMDLKGFHKKVPPECLPEELGGSLGPVDALVEKTIETLRQLKPFFAAEQKQWEDFKQKQRK